MAKVPKVAVTPERVEQTKRFVRDYAELKRVDCDIVTWIALKFSCDHWSAKRLLDAAGDQ